MKTSNFMNFFVRKANPHNETVIACSQATGLVLESDEHPVPTANGFVQFIDYEQGFRMGVCITWHPSAHPCHSQDAVALRLAKELQQEILFDAEDPVTPSGERWVLAMPSGITRTVSVREHENGVDLEDTN
jgi:hypothetical protein